MLRTYIDDGESAKDFDRPSWKSLMKDLETNKKTIDYLIVMKYDRLIRNAAQGLMVLEKIEVRWDIKVLSASEHISIDPHSPFFFKMRADMLVNAEFERRVISERSKFGVWRAKSEGRFIGKAPFGYLNARDERDRPIILLDDSKRQIVEAVFMDYDSGLGFKEIIKKYKSQGLNLNGHSAIKRMLMNPVYAGLIEVPGFKDEASRLVEGKHSRIIEEGLFFRVSDKAGGNTQKHTTLNPDVYLRGIVKCQHCENLLTAGNSKGRNRKYWYYLCNSCRKENIRAEVAHSMIYNILSKLSIGQAEKEYLIKSARTQFKEAMNDNMKQESKLRSQLEQLIDKQNNLEEKYISDMIESETYRKWSGIFRRDIGSLKSKLENINLKDEANWELFNANIDNLCRLDKIFESASPEHKQELLRGLFCSGIVLTPKSYRTAFLLPLFSNNAQNISELDIIKTGHINAKYVDSPVSTRSGT